MSRREPRDVEGHIHPDETVVVGLDGVVPGFTRWSTISGIVGISVALIVPRALNLSFLAGIVVIVVVLLVTFGIIYSTVGRQFAARCKPPMSGPYLSLVLTDKRLLVLDRALSSDQPELKEAAAVDEIRIVNYERAGPVSPQRLQYVLNGVEHRAFEFARSEPVRRLVAALTE